MPSLLSNVVRNAKIAVDMHHTGLAPLSNESGLAQVVAALAAAGENEELEKLRTDLTELISLTEQSLLSLMKSKLLAQLDASEQSASALVSTSSVGDKTTTTKTTTKTTTTKTTTTSFETTEVKQGAYSSSSDSSDEDDVIASTSQSNHFQDLDQIIGSKCRAMYSHAWGDMTYHNAMIIEMLPLQEDSEPQVRVMFTQPTHRALVPCQFYLDDRCNYGNNCRYSHGCVIEVKSLKEYVEPDHGSLRLESRCLAKGPDRVWHKGTVVEEAGPDHTLQVMFDRDHSVLTLPIADVVPLVASEENNDSSDDDVIDDDTARDPKLDSSNATRVPKLDSSEDEEEALPVYLWRPGQCNERMADWEKHTRGIGSKLMRRQGYVMGQGLGRNQEGRTEAVPIELIPAGKSLDKIMELKEKAGTRDLYDVMKRQKRTQKRIDAKAQAAYNKPAKQNVFEFINHKLGDRARNVKENNAEKESGNKITKQTKHISQKDLKSKSEKNLNIQLFQTAEEIRNTEREIRGIKSSLSRNKGEPVIVKRMQEKLAAKEKYLQHLKSSESSIQSHKNTRKDQKKLSIF